jgi:hypothetical protein
MVDNPDPGTLSFPVSTENLNGAIELLRKLGGLAQYPEAYQALVLERSRRELQSPAHEIRLSRATFDALPPAGSTASDDARRPSLTMWPLYGHF